MNINNKETNEFNNEYLKTMQSWDLDRKISTSLSKIAEFYNKFQHRIYVSFSGGKDSTVLADLVSRICKINNHKLILWFSDTGLEYPEVREHVKSFPEYLQNKHKIEIELIMDYPKDRKGNRITFKEIILSKGYPIISKEVAAIICDARSALKKGNLNSYALKKLNNEYRNPITGEVSDRYNRGKWKFLLNAPFKISSQCCNVMKKNPSHKFQKQSGLKPIIGTMACESMLRKSHWLQSGCNSFSAKYPSSKPISFWMEQDILEYIVKYDIPYPSVYGKIIRDKNGIYSTTGLNRTGCVFCGFGCHLEKEPNRFQRLKESHPKIWEYCMKPVEEGGIGMKKVLDYIDVESD